MKEQQLQDKLDEYYNRGIQHGIRMMKDKMLLACRKGTPIEIDGRVYYIRSDLDNLKEITDISELQQINKLYKILKFQSETWLSKI